MGHLETYLILNEKMGVGGSREKEGEEEREEEQEEEREEQEEQEVD
jgi:hypothetical protein